MRSDDLEIQTNADSADFARVLFESMGDGCFTCRLVYEGGRPVDWEFLQVNPAFRRLAGLGDLVGRRISEVVPGFHESSPDLLTCFGRVAAGGPPEILASSTKPLNAWGPVEVMSPGPGQVIAKFRPAALEPAGMPLPEQVAFIHSILDNLPIGIAVSAPDPASHSTYMNDLFPKLYRTTREALGGPTAGAGTFWECAYEDPAMRAAVKARVMEDIGSGDPARMHWERIPITRKGQETTYVDALNLMVPGTSLMISTVWDATDKVRREEDVCRFQAHLHQVQKMESLGLLAGGVAHDINNVLGSILAVATIHRRKAEEGSTLRRDMETITKACLRGGSLVESLRGFARKEPDTEVLLNLNGLVRNELELLGHDRMAPVAIRQELSDALHGIKGDPAALGHAIKSLCANALEAMPEGGILRVRTWNEGPDMVGLEVEDTGTGMTPDVLNQAAVPFFTTKLSAAGSGLGLSIAYGTIRSHRGTMEVQSKPGHGTLVHIRLPASGPLPGGAAGAVPLGG